MTDRKFARYILTVGLILLLMGGAQVLLHIDYKDGLPLMLMAGIVLTFGGLVSVVLNRRLRDK